MANKVQHRSYRNLIARTRLPAARAALALAAVLLLIAPSSAQAQTFTTLYSFSGTDADPESALVQATNGSLYGTTPGGGTNGGGTVFKINPNGTLTTLYSFCSQSGCTDGSAPFPGLVQATDGNFYGTTSEGGTSSNCSGGGCGTVFKISSGGTLTTLYSFCSQSGCPDGSNPGTLIQASDGNLYGASGGGANGDGTIFKITPSGTLTTLHSFDGADGDGPGALVQAADGSLYGTTGNGGLNNWGSVFKITPSGKLVTLYSFCSQGENCADGGGPNAGLIQATDGNLYGTTVVGGTAPFAQGTVFKITPNGTLTTLYSFCYCTGGANPNAGVVQATDGNLYGTTEADGANHGGTVFEITPSGTLTTLYNFCSQSGCVDGAAPFAALVQDTNGMFYGTTAGGGANGIGTVFSLSMGLGPFVETQPASGKAGTVVKILGTNLAGSTSVRFNGRPASFKVISSSLIGATVPEGATSGKVEVTTLLSTLRSNLPFRVRP